MAGKGQHMLWAVVLLFACNARAATRTWAQRPDGYEMSRAGWHLALRQHTLGWPGEGVDFATVNAGDIQATEYSIVGELELMRQAVGIFHFRMVWHEKDTWKPLYYNEWTQISHPLDDTVQGFRPIALGQPEDFIGLCRGEKALLKGSLDETQFLLGSYYGAPKSYRGETTQFAVSLYVNIGGGISDCEEQMACRACQDFNRDCQSEFHANRRNPWTGDIECFGEGDCHRFGSREECETKRPVWQEAPASPRLLFGCAELGAEVASDVGHFCYSNVHLCSATLTQTLVEVGMLDILGHTIEVQHTEGWLKLAEKQAGDLTTMYEEEITNALVKQSGSSILRLDSFDGTLQHSAYLRRTGLSGQGPPEFGWDNPFRDLLDTWPGIPDSGLWSIHNSYSEALLQTKAWKECPPDSGVGYPGTCDAGGGQAYPPRFASLKRDRGAKHWTMWIRFNAAQAGVVFVRAGPKQTNNIFSQRIDFRPQFDISPDVSIYVDKTMVNGMMFPGVCCDEPIDVVVLEQSQQGLNLTVDRTDGREWKQVMLLRWTAAPTHVFGTSDLDVPYRFIGCFTAVTGMPTMSDSAGWKLEDCSKACGADANFEIGLTDQSTTCVCSPAPGRISNQPQVDASLCMAGRLAHAAGLSGYMAVYARTDCEISALRCRQGKAILGFVRGFSERFDSITAVYCCSLPGAAPMSVISSTISDWTRGLRAAPDGYYLAAVSATDPGSAGWGAVRSWDVARRERPANTGYEHCYVNWAGPSMETPGLMKCSWGYFIAGVDIFKANYIHELNHFVCCKPKIVQCDSVPERPGSGWEVLAPPCYDADCLAEQTCQPGYTSPNPKDNWLRCELDQCYATVGKTVTGEVRTAQWPFGNVDALDSIGDCCATCLADPQCVVYVFEPQRECNLYKFYTQLEDNAEKTVGRPYTQAVWQGRQMTCDNVNECDTPRICDANAACTDTLGSYHCDCNTGYVGTGAPGNCADADECADQTDLCNHMATCENIPGGYICTCETGYHLEEWNCVDDNECAAAMNPCGEHATCTEVPGSYTCDCQQGFESVSGNQTCTDVNECSEPNMCSPKADCSNSIGGYFCTCRSGWTGDGRTCMDVDECAGGNHTCASESECMNVEGDYICTPYIIPGSVTCSGGCVAPLTLSVIGGDQVSFRYNVGRGAVIRSPFYLGAIGQPAAFACTIMSSEVQGFDIDVVCASRPGQGQGLAMALSWCDFGGAVCQYAVDQSVLLNYDAPAIHDGSLNWETPGARTPVAIGEDLVEVQSNDPLGGEVLVFTGENFYPIPGFVTVVYGSASSYYECDVDYAKSSQTKIVCQTRGDATGSGLRFRLLNGPARQAVAQGQDHYTLSDLRPRLTSVIGCPGTTASGGTSHCPTQGGTRLYMQGANLVEPLTVQVDGLPCTSLTVSPTLSCNLPPGAGDAILLVIANGVPSAFLRDFVVYSRPILLLIEAIGCVPGANNLTLSKCPRGGGNVLSITGQNFGQEGALVMIGPLPCANVTHVVSHSGIVLPNGRHGHLTCIIPSGVGVDLAIDVWGEGSDRADERASLSYLTCGVGTAGANCSLCSPGHFQPRQGQTECLPCPRGQAQNMSGAESCEVCLAGSAQPREGQRTCDICPPGRFSNQQAQVECLMCSPGHYAAQNASLTCLGCPLGRFQPSSDSPSCRDCPVGRVSPAIGQPTCRDCPAGTYSSRNGSDACTRCLPGRSQPLAGQGECILCKLGRFREQDGASTCDLCAAGQVANRTGSTQCFKCLPGYAQLNEGQDSCDICPPGTSAASEGSVVCAPCAEGRAVSSEGSVSCGVCAAGTFAPTKGSAQCFPCVTGSYAAFTGQSLCRECGRGSYAAATGAQGCDICPAGKFADNTGSRACSPCPSGTAIDVSGQSSCVVCSPGRVQPTEGALTCVGCGSGWYQPDTRQRTCLACPKGFSSVFGSSSCRPCDSGLVAATTGAPACRLCQARSTPTEDRTNCLCDPGYYSQLPHSDCLVANVNNNSTNSTDVVGSGAADVAGNTTAQQPVCAACPPGSDCDSKGNTFNTLHTRPGYWRRDSCSLTWTKCLIPDHCLGGLQSKCDSHRTGLLCSSCVEGYGSTRVTSPCEKCPVQKNMAWGQAIGLILLFALIYCLMCYAVLRLGKHQATVLLDNANTSRTSLLDFNFDALLQGSPAATAPELARTSTQFDVLAHQSAGSSRSPSNADTTTGVNRGRGASLKRSGSSFVRQGSSVRLQSSGSLKDLKKATTGNSFRHAPNFVYKMKILVGFFQIADVICFQGDLPWPSYFRSFIRVFSFVNFDFIPWQSIGCATKVDVYGKALLVAVSPLIVMLLLVLFFFIPSYILDRRDMSDDTRYRQSRSDSRLKFWKLFLFTSFLFYPHVCSTILGIYNCISLDGIYYLTADPSQQCFVDPWNQWAILFVIFIIIYPIGVPLGYFIVLRRYRTKLRSPRVMLKLGFLYEAYTDKNWFFELVDMGHKVAMTSLLVFLPNHLEMGFDMGVAAAYLIILLLAAPYIRKGDDRLHLLVQVNIFLLALMGWTLQNWGKSSLDFATDILISALLIALVVLLMIVFLLMFLQNGKKIIQRARRRKTLAKGNVSRSGSLGSLSFQDPNVQQVPAQE